MNPPLIKIESSKLSKESQKNDDDSYDSDVASNLMLLINKEYDERYNNKSGLWSYYADFMLENLFESSVFLLENGEERLISKTDPSKGY